MDCTLSVKHCSSRRWQLTCQELLKQSTSDESVEHGTAWLLFSTVALNLCTAWVLTIWLWKLLDLCFHICFHLTLPQNTFFSTWHCVKCWVEGRSIVALLGCQTWNLQVMLCTLRASVRDWTNIIISINLYCIMLARVYFTSCTDKVWQNV